MEELGQEEESLTVMRMRAEAKLRLGFEDQISLSARYKTIFLGLKLNTEHSSTVIQPLGFLLRRLIYALLIVFCSEASMVNGVALLCLSTVALAFTVIEKPWADPTVHAISIFNECAFFVILLVAVSVTAFSEFVNLTTCGNFIIWLVTLSIFVNLFNILLESWSFVKLLYTRHLNKSLTHKIAPVPISQSARKHQLDDVAEVDEENSLKKEDLELQNFEADNFTRQNPKKLYQAATGDPSEFNPHFADLIKQNTADGVTSLKMRA